MIARDIARQKQDDEDRFKLIQDLTSTLSEVKTLAGLLPLCTSCKRIREDKDTWLPIEAYLANKCDATFTQSTCPECSGKSKAGSGKKL